MIPENAPTASQPIQRQIPWKYTTETSPPVRPGENWPDEAKAVMKKSGIEPDAGPVEYEDAKPGDLHRRRSRGYSYALIRIFE